MQALQGWSFPQRIWNSGDINRYCNIYIHIEVKTKRTFLIIPLLLPIQSDKIADNSMGNNFLGRIAEVLEVLWNVLSNTFLKYLLWIDPCYILSHRHWQNYAIASKKENKKQGIIKKTWNTKREIKRAKNRKKRKQRSK